MGVTVCGPVPIGNIDDFHIFKSRRLVNQSWMWWDGNEGLPSPFGTSHGNGYEDDLLWQIVRSWPTIQKSLSVDWYFYRDAIDPEPTVWIYDDDDITPLMKLEEFVSHWLEENCESPDWCGGADLDQNGRIDFKDFAILASEWFVDTK